MNRRQFSLAALSSATLLASCHSESQTGPKPARDATLFHNGNVRAAVSDVQQGMNALEMRLSQFNAENWQDALEAAEVAATRLHANLDELRRALGYGDAG